MHPILDNIEQHAANRPNHVAVSDDTLTLTYAELCVVAGGLAQQIDAATSQPRVGILAPPSAACATAALAAWHAGRTPVPLNFLLAPAELGTIIRDARLDCVLTIPQLAGPADAAGLKTIMLGAETFRPGQGPAPQAADQDLGVLIYTSGTTGTPKGACLSFANLTQNVHACVEAAELTSESVFLSLLPQFHAFGFTTNTLVPLMLGATVIYQPRFVPTAVVSTIAERGVSVLITIASMFSALAAMKSATREQFATLTHPVSGGEPLPRRTAAAFEQRFGRVILEGYGMTEASPVVSLNTPSANRPGTVGRPIPGITVTAVDDDGRAVPPDTDGQLVVRGHCVMQGYLNQPEQTAAVLRDGALWTGDVGRIDKDGFITITGRAKDMLIVGGENVFPIEIEQVLLDHAAVAEVAVIGRPDDIRGEVPVAYVTLRDGATATPADLRGHCRAHLAAYKVPRAVHIAGDLPRGPTGKILKRALPAAD